MARGRREPLWLSRMVLDAVHADQVREHGGMPGVRHKNVLESALARPKQKWTYAAERDLAALAAACAFGIARNHPYRDGNKRIAFLALATFLGINGQSLEATDAEVVTAMLALAAGPMSEDELTVWIRAHLT